MLIEAERIQMKWLLIIFTVIAAPLAVFAENSPAVEQVIPWDSNSKVDYRKPPREKIDELRKNPSFNYERAEKTDGLLSRLWLRLMNWLRKVPGGNRWLLYFLGSIAVLFVVYLILRMLNIAGVGFFVFAKSDKSTALNLQLPAEAKTKEEFMQLFKFYRNNGAYREAVRMLYLIYLRGLSDSGLIKLTDHKTNRDYARELKDSSLQKTFRQLSRQYDYVWFGQFELANAKYLQIEHDFKESGNIEIL